MKKILSILLFSGIIFSCEKYPFQGTEVLENIYFDISGTDQITETGTYVPDSVGVIIDMLQFKYDPEKEIKIDLEIIEGGGSVDQKTVFLNSAGKMLTRWKLGTNSTFQKLEATISDSDDKYFSSLQIQATSYVLGEWNTFTKGYFTNISDMVADTINHRSIMIENRRLKKIINNSFQSKALNVINTSFHSVEMDGLGNVYVGSRDGRLYKILDWDSWWQPCGRPIPNYYGDYELTVTPDNYIWLSCAEHGIYFSKDGAQSWQNTVSGIYSNEVLGRIYQLKDSSHITFSQTRGLILQSIDEGLNWLPINTPNNALNCYVTENSDIITITRESGYSLYLSTDLGQNYTKIHTIFSTNYNLSLSHSFVKYGIYYYIIVPGAEIIRTTDFSNFEKIRTVDVQRYLHIDHLGTIFVSGNSGQPTYILSQ